MSAGFFVPGLYETNDGLVTTGSFQVETLALESDGVVNEITGLAPTVGLPTVTVSGGRRGRGRIFSRMISLRLVNPSDPPAGGYVPNGILRVPITTQTLWQLIPRGGTVSYLGKQYRVVGKQAEKIS